MKQDNKNKHLNRKAIVITNGLAERKEHPCVVIGSTKTHWHIRVEQDTRLPNQFIKAGECGFVPKFAVKFV